MSIEVDSTSGILTLARAHALKDDVAFIGDFERTILELTCLTLGAQKALEQFFPEGTAENATAGRIRTIRKAAQDALVWLSSELAKSAEEITIPKIIWDQLPKS